MTTLDLCHTDRKVKLLEPCCISPAPTDKQHSRIEDTTDSVSDCLLSYFATKLMFVIFSRTYLQKPFFDCLGSISYRTSQSQVLQRSHISTGKATSTVG